MPDFERLIDDLKIQFAKSAVTREWASGYKSGKSRARWEVFWIIVALYFAIALIGKFSGVSP